MTEATDTFHYHVSLLQGSYRDICVIRIVRKSSLLLNLPVCLVLRLHRAHASAVH